MMHIWCPYVAYIGRKSRTERPRKTTIGTDVAHFTRDSDTTFMVKRSKVNLQGAGSYCGILPHSCSICNVYGAVMYNKGHFLLTPMLTNSNNIQPTEYGFGVKHFWQHWAKIYASQGMLWMRWKKNGKAHEGAISPIALLTPFHSGHCILHVGLDCWRNQMCQISDESVLGF